MAIELQNLQSPPELEPRPIDETKSRILERVAAEAVAQGLIEKPGDLYAGTGTWHNVFAAGLAAEIFRLEQRVKEGVRSCMAPFSRGQYLDGIAANQQVFRKEITPANPETGEPAKYQTNEFVRAQMATAFASRSTAGPLDGWLHQARKASPFIADIGATSPDGLHTKIVVLSTESDGTPTAELVTTVREFLEPYRPLETNLEVLGASVVHWDIDVLITAKRGTGSRVKASSLVALEMLGVETHRVNRTITRAEVDQWARSFIATTADGDNVLAINSAALAVEVREPQQDVVVDVHEAPKLVAVNVSVVEGIP